MLTPEWAKHENTEATVAAASGLEHRKGANDRHCREVELTPRLHKTVKAQSVTV